MVILLIGRSAAAVAGALLVLAAWTSVIRTLIVPRRTGTWVRASRARSGAACRVLRMRANYLQLGEVVAAQVTGLFRPPG